MITKRKRALCKSLGTLLDYSLLLFIKRITKAQTQAIYLLGLQ